MWAYHEATKTGIVFIQALQRECQRINYARRRTGDWFLDTGSIPVWSTYGKSHWQCSRWLLMRFKSSSQTGKAAGGQQGFYDNKHGKPTGEKPGFIGKKSKSEDGTGRFFSRRQEDGGGGAK